METDHTTKDMEYEIWVKTILTVGRNVGSLEVALHAAVCAQLVKDIIREVEQEVWQPVTTQVKASLSTDTRLQVNADLT